MPAAAAPAAPAFGAYQIRQMLMLPLLWGMNKIDLTTERNQNILFSAAAAVFALGYMIIHLCMRRARRANDTTRVENPGQSMYLKDQDKAADGTVSAMQYDLSKLQESKFQFMMSAAIAVGLNYKWGYTQPLVLLCFMQPLQLFDNKALKIHLLGASGPDYERPWAAANADNPLAQWAERKRNEQQEAQAALAKKDE